MATKKPAPINLLEDALAVNAGAPVEVTLYDTTFKVKRDYTGDQVAAYIALFGEDGPKTVKEQMIAQLDMLTDLSKEKREQLVDKLMGIPFAVASSVATRIGQIAGLRGDDTGFLTGTLR